MKRLISLFSFLAIALFSVAETFMHPVFGFPSTEPGYALGVSACYAGRIGDYLVMAGGCNFPVAGKKKYYTGIYAARIDKDVLQWRLVGWLPEPAAYGVTVESGDSLLFIGGCNNERSLSSVYSVHLNEGSRASVTSLKPLPATIDNMAASRLNNDVYVFGGNHNGLPSASMLRMSLSNGNGEWQEVGNSTQRPRVQPVCAATGGKVYVWGGFDNSRQGTADCKVHTDGLCFNPESGEWTQLASPCSSKGISLTLSGGVAWSMGGCIYATGGVNKDIFLDAITGSYNLVAKKDYLLQPVSWYRFGDNLLCYDTTTGHWQKPVAVNAQLARAGAQAIVTELGVYYIGGELKPAVRTPQICLVEFCY